MDPEEYNIRKRALVKEIMLQKKIHCERNAADRKRRLVKLVMEAENVNKEQAQKMAQELIESYYPKQ